MNIPSQPYPEHDKAALDHVIEIVDEIHQRSFEHDDCGDSYHLEMTDVDRVPFAILWLKTEVNNGGFHQFFYNGTGAIAVDTVRILNLIGAHQTAKLLQQALVVFPSGNVPRDDDERRALLERITEEQYKQLQALDECFYASEEDLCLMAIQYHESLI